MHSTSSSASAQPLLQPSTARLTELSHAACDYVQRATSLDLDHSEESLAFVDHYLRQVRAGQPLQAPVLELIAAALGVYFGELLLARFGGRWLAIPTEPHHDSKAETPLLDSLDDPTGWRVELEAAPLICDPVLWAQQALRFAREDEDKDDEAQAALGGEGGLIAPPKLLEPLQDAMARLPPVSEEYYYSLTGRFETVSVVVEVLASLRAAAEDEGQADDDSEQKPRKGRDKVANSQ